MGSCFITCHRPAEHSQFLSSPLGRPEGPAEAMSRQEQRGWRAALCRGVGVGGLPVFPPPGEPVPAGTEEFLGPLDAPVGEAHLAGNVCSFPGLCGEHRGQSKSLLCHFLALISSVHGGDTGPDGSQGLSVGTGYPWRGVLVWVSEAKEVRSVSTWGEWPSVGVRAPGGGRVARWRRLRA